MSGLVMETDQNPESGCAEESDIGEVEDHTLGLLGQHPVEATAKSAVVCMSMAPERCCTQNDRPTAIGVDARSRCGAEYVAAESSGSFAGWKVMLVSSCFMAASVA